MLEPTQEKLSISVGKERWSLHRIRRSQDDRALNLIFNRTTDLNGFIGVVCIEVPMQNLIEWASHNGKVNLSNA